MKNRYFSEKIQIMKKIKHFHQEEYPKAFQALLEIRKKTERMLEKLYHQKDCIFLDQSIMT